jgi:arsenate reductase
LKKPLVLIYPKCSTCKKAIGWLEDAGVEVEIRHIVEENPTAEELKTWWKKSGLPLKRFFNTSGMKYRELHLKDKLPTMTEQEQLDLLATDGMLVKRPLVVGEKILVGFKVKEWEKNFQ